MKGTSKVGNIHKSQFLGEGDFKTWGYNFQKILLTHTEALSFLEIVIVQ